MQQICSTCIHPPAITQHTTTLEFRHFHSISICEPDAYAHQRVLGYSVNLNKPGVRSTSLKRKNGAIMEGCFLIASKIPQVFRPSANWSSSGLTFKTTFPRTIFLDDPYHLTLQEDLANALVRSKKLKLVVVGVSSCDVKAVTTLASYHLCDYCTFLR